ncbi:MAG TPA: DUF3108 domain-containing protein [bacterium]|nr:DUF3108 domain-containing protein [bacterium]
MQRSAKTRSNLRGWFVTLTAAAVLTLAIVAVVPAQGTVDFAGENLVYEFGWSGISAATAEIRVLPVVTDGVPCYKVQMRIKGQPKLDWIWKVRDEIEVVTTVADLRCKHYLFKQRESSFHLDTEIRHDKAQGLLLGSRTRLRQGEAQPLKPNHAPDDHYDPLSALIFARRAPLSLGKTYQLKAFDGKRRHDLTYTVMGEEHIKIGLGEFDAWKIWPRIERSSGADVESKVNKVRKATLWIDKQPPHHVLKVETEAFVGSIYAELIRK